MAYGAIYLVTNAVSDKQYVGQTKTSLRRRWISHVSAARTLAPGSPILHAAIRKHGPAAFTMERIVDAPSRLALNAYEHFWVGVIGCVSPAGYTFERRPRAKTEN